MSRCVPWVICGSALILQIGCSSPRGKGPYSAVSEATRDPQEAQRLTMQAADLIHTDSDEAERMLRQALTHDLYHGPAHNNLGAIHLARGELYEAASEFEWARKLMPGHPDPRLNLGIALERAGRVSEAVDAYRTALDVYPGHLHSTQALVRCQLRHGVEDDQTKELLRSVALHGGEGWRSWARGQLLKLESP